MEKIGEREVMYCPDRCFSAGRNILQRECLLTFSLLLSSPSSINLGGGTKISIRKVVIDRSKFKLGRQRKECACLEGEGVLLILRQFISSSLPTLKTSVLVA